jgi:hypothetical protein
MITALFHDQRLFAEAEGAGQHLISVRAVGGTWQQDAAEELGGHAKAIEAGL